MGEMSEKPLNHLDAKSIGEKLLNYLDINSWVINP